jgi:vacuolar iron transporter family protein
MGKISTHERATYLGDAVFSASDGLITTFAVIAGSTGAALGTNTILILGFANLFADGISMAAGRYLGAKSEVDYETAEGYKGRNGSPLMHGVVTFFSFNLIGIIPIIPFIFIRNGHSFLISALAVAATMFAVGVARSYFTKKRWFVSGFEMFAIGGLAAVTAYFTGYFLQKYVI